MAEVVLNSITKRFAGGITAVQALDLHVANGEFVVLVGPSGCGKTTTLRMVAGLENPTSGTVRIGDRVVNRVLPKDRDVAMVFQDYALYPHLTVRQNLSFPLTLRKVSRDEITRRVNRAAELLGLTDLLNRRPGALSGGQQQRVALARAIVRQPKCYLFDEPLSNLDATLRTSLRAEIKTLHRQLAATTLYVTHDQEEAMTLGDRLVVMDRGVVQQIGSPMEIYRTPANRFVAGFVGSPAMNFIDGRLARIDGRLRFTDRGDVSLALDDETALRLADRADELIVLGIRPEQMRPEARTGDAPSTITITVNVTEPLGDRMDVLGSTAAGTPMCARVDTTTGYRTGDRATFHIHASGLHLFAPDDPGRRL